MRKNNPPNVKQKSQVWIYLLFVLVTSFFTYVFHFSYPPYPFWDEPYHIASAQKYLNGVSFMEQHPPLGKLFIALGEKITRSDPKESQFINTDYARNIPTPFDFTGYRLFPTLFGWLTAPLLFLIFLLFTESAPLSALFSFLYIFDNAEILQSRSAMLDSTLTFFSVLTIYLFLLIIKSKNNKDIWQHIFLSFLFGASFGLVVTTKVVGLILILLLPAALWWFFPDWRRIVRLLVPYLFGFLLVYITVWQIHFSLGSRIVPQLPDNGYYQASGEYKQILNNHENGSLKYFPIMLRDSLKYVTHYNSGVPHLDLCKVEENGSPAYFWPFGARTIDFRWEKAENGQYRYLYLVSNPAGWGLGLLGIVLGTIVFIGPFFTQPKEKFSKNYLLGVFLGLYFCYMIAVLQITRVMYLYHYFLPLIFSYIIFGLVVGNIPRIGQFVLNENRRLLIMTFLGLLVFAFFQFYRPFTYYEPMTNGQVKLRNLNPLWEIKCVECAPSSTLVSPRDK
jgi:dolichyl-phosphate-mannose--protein O-mannosyl transferase